MVGFQFWSSSDTCRELAIDVGKSIIDALLEDNTLENEQYSSHALENDSFEELFWKMNSINDFKRKNAKS